MNPSDYTFSEDCLYLNVFTPYDFDDSGRGRGGTRRKSSRRDGPRKRGKERLPVMVWIHGGAFTLGSGVEYNSSLLAAAEDIVVVPINYRLGTMSTFLLTLYIHDHHMAMCYMYVRTCRLAV